MRRLLPLLVVAALSIAGCSSRERTNPFDPRNPSTSGRPPGFIALAGDREVRLQWQDVRGNTLIGYQIFRKGPFDTRYGAITDVLGLGVSSFRDFPLPNDEEYSYRLYFVFVSGIGNLPAEDTATPGSAVPWVIEGGGTDLIQVTPDDRRVVARRGGYGSTTDLVVNPRDGVVWVADEGFGRVVVFDPASDVTVSIPRFDRPRAVAVDAFDATGWVCDVGQNLVMHYRPDGLQESFPIAPTDQPVDVAVDPQDGSVWVCELGGNRVGRFVSTTPVFRHTVAAPTRVAVDSTTREGWITSYSNGTVTHLSSLGTPLPATTGFTSPLGVAMDPRRGRIWIADPGAARVVALRRDGSEEFRVNGLSDAGELAVDLRTGDAWVVLGRPGELVRISPTGAVLRRLGGFISPIAVSVDAGGR
jgi:DNA-binding beta-propeller fold protein YncE